MIHRIIIIPLLLCLAFTSFSQKILKITTLEESNAIFQDYIEVYVDSTNSLDFDQISSEDFSKHFIPVSEFGDETSLRNTYWLHFILENKIADSLSIGFYFHDDNQVVIVYSILDGSIQRKRVGFMVTGKDISFTNHQIHLEMGDTFYLFSDGFIDQKGGRDNKKFMSKNFKNLLLEIHDQPMHEQKDILDKTLSDWMGENSQMDDALVIGVRV